MEEAYLNITESCGRDRHQIDYTETEQTNTLNSSSVIGGFGVGLEVGLGLSAT